MRALAGALAALAALLLGAGRAEGLASPPAARRALAETPCAQRSCDRGRCRFVGCAAPVSCAGGACEMEGCFRPTCKGGSCVFDACEFPSCAGGRCEFRNLVTSLDAASCTGGACTMDDGNTVKVAPDQDLAF